MTEKDVEAFRRCISRGGVVLFPSDTVYGLAVDPDSRASHARLHRLKGRLPGRPGAVMFFRLELAIDALPELGPRTRAAVQRLLPGPLTLLLPNLGRRYPLACGGDPLRIGLRVPELGEALETLRSASWPVLQSSANLTGEPDARRLEDVDQRIRQGVDLELDGGELPGVSSTVLDLTGYESDGSHTVVREGAVPAEHVATAL